MNEFIKMVYDYLANAVGQHYASISQARFPLVLMITLWVGTIIPMRQKRRKETFHKVQRITSM